jgi:hypothetical protein
MTAAAFGEVASTDKASMFNYDNYNQTTTADGTIVYVNVPKFGGTLEGNLVDETEGRFKYADFSPKAYCLDSYKNTSDPCCLSLGVVCC